MSSSGRVSLFGGFLCLVGLWPISMVAQGAGSTQVEQAASAPAKADFKFDVVSVRPVTDLSKPGPGITQNGFDGLFPLRMLIMLGYAPEEFPASLNPDGTTRISNPPNWINEFYRINARVADADLEVWRNQGVGYPLYKAGLRDILRDRFKLVFHTEPAQFSGLHLVMSGKTVKMKETPPGFVFPPGAPLRGGGVRVGKGREWHYYGATMENLAAFLSLTTGLPVLDATGLTGHYEFVVQAAEHTPGEELEPVDRWPVDQLGLALKPGKVSGRTLIIDHIEKPSEN